MFVCAGLDKSLARDDIVGIRNYNVDVKMTNNNCNTITALDQSMRLIRLTDVRAKTGLSRSSIYARMDANSKGYDQSFPATVNLGGRSVAWVEAEIDAWIASKIVKRNQALSETANDE